MKHIDKEILHAGAGRMIMEGIKTTETDRNGLAVVRKTLSLPRKVHSVAAEIIFRCETTLKKFVVNSLTELPNDGTAEFSSFDYSNPVSTSVIIPCELYRQVRQSAHDNKVSKRVLVTEAVVRYIKNHYLSRYPDIPGIKDL